MHEDRRAREFERIKGEEHKGGREDGPSVGSEETMQWRGKPMRMAW